jgi:hypothetical protein
MDESVYKQMTKGLHLSAIVQSMIIDLNEQSIYDILNFLYEKVILS